MGSKESLLLLGVMLLGGCTTTSRRPAPPDLISTALPDGYPPTVRLLTIDQQRFASQSPRFFDGISKAATDGTVDILALSGGGSDGAFGAGALVGMSRAHTRPQFELVTGVSAGALIAPFAILGPDWDVPLHAAFSGERSRRLLRAPHLRMLARLLFPHSARRHGRLFDLVDHYVTPKMIDAVARATAKGRHLIVATTDLDKQETVLWDMGVIAARGGEPARELFRDVLIASASVPGIFPPVLIHVREGNTHYDELHVDGSVTTSVFITPLIAQILPKDLPQLKGANVYMIVNGQLARRPRTTPLKTTALLRSSFSAGMTYKTRETIVSTIALTKRLGMRFRLTEVPVDYPLESFMDFRPKHMQALFDYAADCATRGLLWMTPAQSIKRNMTPVRATGNHHTTCPASPAGAPK